MTCARREWRGPDGWSAAARKYRSLETALAVDRSCAENHTGDWVALRVDVVMTRYREDTHILDIPEIFSGLTGGVSFPLPLLLLPFPLVGAIIAVLPLLEPLPPALPLPFSIRFPDCVRAGGF